MEKLKLMTILGTRPEIIRLSATIKCCDRYFQQILVHTGQNYDYELNQVFFEDLGLRAPDYYLNAAGASLGETIGTIIAKSYALMQEVRPDAVLVLGDTNSCLSVIAAKRLHIPIFHMEAGNRCFDECLPEETNRRIVDVTSDVNLCYSEHARRYLNAAGVPKERRYCIRICHRSRPATFTPVSAWKEASTSCSPPTGRRISTRRRISVPCSQPSMPWRSDMTCRCCTPAIPEAASDWRRAASHWTGASSPTSPWAFTITTACK